MSRFLVKLSSSWQLLINVSANNETWETVSAVCNFDPKNNNISPFSLDRTVKCKHFRIVEKDNFCCVNYLIFSFIDIFGSISDDSNRACTCKRKYTKPIEDALNNCFLMKY